MAPRSGKRRYRARNPIPVWLPLPRPCLRSLNMPGPPYYMPISPQMYLPPWALPPPFFTKPMCHCANENFCTTSNCRNSTECLKTHPTFCPHGNKQVETSDLQQNIIHEQQDSNDDQGTSSSSDLNTCSACGAPPRKLKTLGTKSNLRQDNRPELSQTPKVPRTQDSFTSSHYTEQKGNQEPEHINLEGKDIADTENKVEENDNGTKFRQKSPEAVLSNKHSKSTVNTSCQTACSNSLIRRNRLITPKRYDSNSPRRDSRSSESNYAEESEASQDRNVNLSDTHKALNDGNINEFGCNSCSKRKHSSVNSTENLSTSKSSVMNKDLAGATKKSEAGNIHMHQLPDNISNARKRQANKYTGCCFPRSEKNCKASVEVDAMNKPIMEIPHNTSKSLKKAKCECSSINKHSKASSRSSFKDTTRFRKKSKCECSPNKTSYKPPSKSDKLSECGCSSTKITQKTKPRKVSECSCPSTELPRKISSRTRKERDSEFSTERSIPKACPSKLSTKESNKTCNDLTSLSTANVKQSNCQCKYPPAYGHLSCMGNLTDNCSCSNNN